MADRLYVGKIVVKATGDGNSPTVFIESRDKALGQLLRNGNISKEAFIDNFKEIDITLKDVVEHESMFDHYKNAQKPCGSFDFSVALTALKAGYKIAREGWNGKNMHIEMYKDVAVSKNRIEVTIVEPWFGITGPTGSINTWVPSISDIMANDWCLV